MSGAALRPIWLCADDYGLSPGVNRAIRELIAQGRINATSAMVVGPTIDRAEVQALQAAAASSRRCALGLHVTLTAPFRPLTLHFRPLDSGMFLPLAKMLRKGLVRRLDREIIHTEILAQLAAFTELFGRPPDFVDGHQHVQLFPQIREAFLSAAKQAAPAAWVRQGGRARGLSLRTDAPKALFLDLLSARFRQQARRRDIAFNTAFAGAYDFTAQPDFAGLMASFLDGLPPDGLIMCHPGFVDDLLRSLDPFTTQREREYAYLAGGQFPGLLAAHGVTLA